MKISVIVAMAGNGVIGRAGGLPWHISEDLKHFKKTTMNHPIIMGRKTWESIGRPLPGRLCMVISRNPEYRLDDYPADQVMVFPSLDQALMHARAATADEAFVIGGAGLFEEALIIADRIYLTEIKADIEGDTFFPEIDWQDWYETARAPGEDSPQDGLAYDFVILERRPDGKAA